MDVLKLCVEVRVFVDFNTNNGTLYQKGLLDLLPPFIYAAPQLSI